MEFHLIVNNQNCNANNLATQCLAVYALRLIFKAVEQMRQKVAEYSALRLL